MKKLLAATAAVTLAGTGMTMALAPPAMADCINKPGPTIDIKESKVRQWQNIDFTGKSPKDCRGSDYQVRVQTRVKSKGNWSKWTTLNAFRPVTPGKKGKFVFHLQLGVKGKNQVRAFYISEGDKVFSNVDTVRVK